MIAADDPRLVSAVARAYAARHRLGCLARGLSEAEAIADFNRDPAGNGAAIQWMLDEVRIALAAGDFTTTVTHHQEH